MDAEKSGPIEGAPKCYANATADRRLTFTSGTVLHPGRNHFVRTFPVKPVTPLTPYFCIRIEYGHMGATPYRVQALAGLMQSVSTPAGALLGGTPVRYG